jgi:aminotransferase
MSDPTTSRFLSDRVSATLGHRAEALTSPITPLVNLGQGTPDLPTPPHIIEAVHQALLDQPRVQYTDYAGIPMLREAIAGKLRRDNGLDYDPDQEIMVTNGSQEAVWIAMQLITDPGDEFLIGDPHYSVYDEVVGLLGGTVVPIPSIVNRGFQYDLDAMEAAITPRTKAVLLVSPDNPTGAVQDPVTVGRVAEIAERHDLFVISDELYERFVFDGAVHTSFATLPGMRERTITIGGFSKTYAMTGWRVGYLAFPAGFRAAALLAKHSISICTPVPSQVAAHAALTGPPEALGDMFAEWTARRTYFYGRMAELGIPVVRTPGAYYAMVDVRATGCTDGEFSHRFAEAEGVRASPGSAFGPAGRHFVRISFMTPRPALDDALDRLGRFWTTLIITDRKEKA